MRKNILAFFMMLVTLLGTSQTVAIFPIDSALATIDSLSTGGVRLSGTGQWHLKAQYQASGTSSWFDTDTTHFGAGVNIFSKGVGGLQPQTTYDVRYVAYNATYSDSFVSITQTGTTKPLPQPAIVTLLQVIPGTQQSAFVFSFSSMVYTSMVCGINIGNGQTMTNTISVIGSGIDTVWISNGPNQVIPSGILVIIPNAQDVDPGQSAPWQAFTTPGYTMPDVVSVTAQSYIDSMRFTVSVHIGNSGNATIVRKALGPNGQVLTTYSGMNTTSDTVISWTEFPITPHTNAGARVIVSSIGGIDSNEVMSQTQQVNEPDLIAWNIYDPTTNTARLAVEVTTNGLWANSVSKCWVRYTNSLGQTVTTDTVYNILGQVTLDSFMLYNLQAGPALNWAAIYIKNAAGTAVAEDIYFTISAPHAAPMPIWGNCTAVSASRIQISGIGYDIPAGTIGSLRVAYRQDGSQTWDTAQFLGLPSSVEVTNLLGGTKYWFKLLGVSQDNLMVENATQKWEITITPSFPIIADITLSQGGGTIIGSLIGSGEGILSECKAELHFIQNGNPIFEDATNWTGVGTDVFDLPFMFTDVNFGGTIEIRGHIRGQDGSNPSSYSKFFENTATGLTELAFEDLRPQIISNCWNSLGQLIGEGKLPADFLKQFAGQEIFIGPQDPYYLKNYKAQHYFPQRK